MNSTRTNNNDTARHKLGIITHTRKRFNPNSSPKNIRVFTVIPS